MGRFLKWLGTSLGWIAPEATKETGEQNARRFVETVARLAKDDRVLIFSPGGIWHVRNERNGWVWMMNERWRARVLDLLRDAPIRDPDFSPPDSLDGWTFVAYSTVPVPRIAQLELNQTL